MNSELVLLRITEKREGILINVYRKLINYQTNRNFVFILFLVSYCGLQLWRGWDVIRLGRFWAEDGSMIWAHALGHNFLSQIFFIPPIAGYFDMNANLYVLISTFFPVLYHPYVVLILSFVTMLLPAIFIYCIRSSSVTQSAETFLIFSFLFAPGLLSAEAFGNAVNGQTYLALYSVLLLIFWPDWLSKEKQRLILIPIVLAMTSGWYSVILTPLFMARARTAKISQLSKFFRWTPIIFLSLQIYAYVVTDLNNLQWPGRNNLSEKWYMPILNFALLPGKAYFGELAIAGYIACLFCFALFLFFVLPIKNFEFGKTPARKILVKNNSFMCFIALLLELTLIGLGQTGRSFGGRYIIVPSGIFLILTVLLVQNRKYSLKDETHN